MHNALRLVATGLRFLPRSWVRRVASRYIAGENREQALNLVLRLRGAGFLVTVDVLGENACDEEEVRAAVDEYLHLVADLGRCGRDTEISVKPTHVGLRLSADLAAESLERIAACAEANRVGLALDMEDSSTTDATIRLYRALATRHPRVGLAIQAYLYRSMGDVEALLPLRPSVRVCKGIYIERPGLVLPDPQSVRENFLRLVDRLLSGGAFVAIATHDPWLVDRCLEIVARSEANSSHEFQMLLGVGEALRERILKRGSPIRLYCPYGYRWYEYSLRRLRENPKLVGYVLKSLLHPRCT